jgi:hypothetical protein
MPTVTSVSVTARPVVLIADVAGTSAKDGHRDGRQCGHSHQQFAPKRRLQAPFDFV